MVHMMKRLIKRLYNVLIKIQKGRKVSVTSSVGCSKYNLLIYYKNNWSNYKMHTMNKCVFVLEQLVMI